MADIHQHKKWCKARQKIASGTTDAGESPAKKLKHHSTGTGSVSSYDDMIQTFITLVLLIVLMDGIKVLHENSRGS